MKSILYLILFFSTIGILGSCSASTSPDPNENNEEPRQPIETSTSLDIGNCLVQTSDKKLEIVTWNVEHFPKTSTTTKEFASFVKDMDVDVLALQEIKNKEALNNLLNHLPGYKGTIMVRSDVNLAFLYKESEISLTDNPYAILKGNTYELPRSPYVLPIHSKSTNLDILVVNNHYKATTSYDSAKKKAKNEARRRAASQLIKNWVDTQHPNDNVIVLGDLNDEITDPKSENVFQIFLDDSANYQFADSEIALEKNQKMWSYPDFPSHIDHILITNELFDNKDNIYTYTFQGCDSNYKNIISDHQPVCLVLK